MNRLLRALVSLLSLLAPGPLGRKTKGRSWLPAVAALAGAVVAVALLAGGRADDDASADKDGRAILGRIWFDKLPESSRDSVHVWLWLGGGIGLHEVGSRVRFSLDLFDFERAGSKVDMKYFQDGKRVQTGFKIEKCDEQPPFDLCLTFDQAPGSGPKKLYGFDYDDDLDSHVPWALSTRRAAEELARAPRP